MKKYINILLILLCTMLAGCGDKASEADVVETSEVEMVEQEAETIADEETIEEDMSGNSSSIDVNSTLKGEEWIRSFVGKVEEPVVVVYNDRTNRKEVVEPNSEVKMSTEDVCAVYHPKSQDDVVAKYIDWSNCSDQQYYKSFKLEPQAANLYATVCVEEWQMSFAIISDENKPVIMPSDEPIIPEGVDINSTLPGEQWMSTFVENGVTEPVVVFFNDETGRKEVVQPYSDVVVESESDRCGIYIPEGRYYPTLNGFMEQDKKSKGFKICKFDFEKLEQTIDILKQDAEMIMKFNSEGEDGNIDTSDAITIPFTLILDKKE